MKRDMDLIKDILLKAEAISSEYFRSHEIEDIKKKKEEIEYQIKIMCDAGFLEPIARPSVSPKRTEDILGYRITWFGHDFLDACRDEARWKQAKDIGAKIGGFTLEVLKQVLTQIMISQVKQVMGQ